MCSKGDYNNMTLSEIENDLIAKSKTLNLEGVVSTSVAKLLAYAIYLDNANLNSKILNSVFSSASSLNNTLAHACNLLYSTYRGETSKVTYRNVIANKTEKYSYLDSAFQYNGNYFYFDGDYDETSTTTIKEVGYIASDKPMLECTAKADKDSYQYIDFTAPNVSEHLVLYGVDSSGNETRLTYTDNPYEFLKNEKNASGEYVYQYMLITNINYSVRLLKRYEEQNDSKQVTWRFPKYKIKYIPYSEFVPDLRSLRSLGDFSYIEDIGATYSNTFTSLETTKFKAREENPEIIYMQATKFFMTRNQIGSITDIEYIIQSHSTDSVVYNIVTRLDDSSGKVVGYTVYVDLEESDRTEISNEIASRNPPFECRIEAMEPTEVVVAYTAADGYYSLADLNEHFNPIWKSTRSLTTAEIVAQVLRYDTEMTQFTVTGINGSTSIVIPELADNHYYNITLSTD